MINIIEDSGYLHTVPNSREIDSLSEFPQFYQEIVHAYNFHVDYSLIVRKEIVAQWFKKMSARYPQGTFVFETLNAKSALAKEWHITIPDSVTNEDILEAKLLSIQTQPHPGYTFEDTLLAYYYSPIFTEKTFPFTKLASLFGDIDTEKWKSNLSIPLVARVFFTRIADWKSKTRTSEQTYLIDAFVENPKELKSKLMSFRVLRSYPSIRELLLGNNYNQLASLKLPLQDLAIDEAEIPNTVLQVTYYLNKQEIEDSETITSLIDSVSGLLSIEFDTIEKHLSLHPDWITTSIINKIEEKFSTLASKFTKRINSLRELIRPQKPNFPELSWGFDQMLSWATESYLPYQAWCNAQEQFDPELFKIGDHFSEWLMRNWDDIHSNSKRMVFNIFSNNAAALRQPGKVNLVLAVDNLGWTFSSMLKDLFQNQGYFLSSAEPYLAMLPSETEISKKCLLSGAVGYQAIDDLTYTGMIEKGWVPYFGNSSFRYISDIGSLKKVNTIDASTYVVNYLAIDKALHKSADEIGMPHPDHILHLLQKLVENTTGFIEKHELQNRIRIHVVSDHGSTRIPGEIQNDINQDFFKSEGIEARSHRYVKTTTARFVSLADNLKIDCFFLPATDFQNKENFLCARRGNRFLPIDKNSYVHGGLLPEEVIVPYMVFEPAAVAVQNLTVLLLRNEFRYRAETVELEIGNPNDTSVEQIQISLLNGNVESEPAKIPQLKSKSNILVPIKVRFKITGIPEEQKSLHIRVRFLAQGEQHTFDLKPNITMRKIVEETSTNIFDD